MDVKKFDKNFAYADSETEILTEYAVPGAESDLYGVFFDNRLGKFLRFPHSVAESVSQGVCNFNACTAGGRLAAKP